MKRIKIIILLALVGLMGIGIAYAGTFANLSVSAKVINSSPELTLEIKELTTPEQSPWAGTTVTTMNFGTLTHILADGTTDAGVWYSQKYYCVIIYTQSYGHKYEVRSTCAGLTSGGNSLPAGSFGLVPGYAAADEWSAGNAQGAKPTGAVLGDAGPAVATDKVIYTSEAAASNRILRAFYSLPCKTTGGGDPFTGYTPIPLNQPNGDYAGTVTITIAQI